MTNQNFVQHTPEFSKIINVVDLSKEDQEIKITATPEECKEIAKRLDLTQLKNFSIRVHPKKTSQAFLFRVEAHLDADVTYTCGVSLDPFDISIHEDVQFLATYAEPQSSASVTEEDLLVDPEEDIIEPLDSLGNLDIGEIMTQYLSVALDPYPRSNSYKEESFVYTEDSSEKERKKSPFEKLRTLK